MTDEAITEEERRLEPDPFGLPRAIHKRVACCGQGECSAEVGDIRYLWVHAGATSLGYAVGSPPPSPLPLESWLNVVDEAASLGAKWLVVTLEAGVTHFPMVWDIFDWAQRTHQMNVALHLNDVPLSDKDAAALLTLERPDTHLFVPHIQIGDYTHLSDQGITVRSADPSTADVERCSMPGNMLFVTAEGKLYTCGMVKGEDEFCLGDINTGFFGQIVHDEHKPHSVCKEAMKRQDGCMGCPPLVLQDHT